MLNIYEKSKLIEKLWLNKFRESFLTVLYYSLVKAYFISKVMFIKVIMKKRKEKNNGEKYIKYYFDAYFI